MTSHLQTFAFDAHAVRVVIRNDSPWFVASDVATALAYRDAHNMTRIIDEDEQGTQIVRTPSGDQEMLVINESGLYSAILKSRKPEAKKFKKWVTSEVLPAIRKTGSYTHPQGAPTVNGQISVELAEYVSLLKQQAELAKLSAQREQTRSAMGVAAALMQDGNYSREEIAQIAGIDLHTVDYIFADLCREAAKQGVHSFRMRHH